MDSSFWDERFSKAGFAYGDEPNDFLRAEAERIPPGPVLSLGEGEGRNATFLATLGHAVTAVDFSRAGLDKAKMLAESRGVTLDLVHADLTHYELERNRFTGIIMIWCHTFPETRRRLMASIADSLVVGGCFLLEAYAPAQLKLGTGGPKDVSLLVSAADLRKELVGLDLAVVREVEREIHEGPFHGGMSATTQVIAYRR